MPQPIDETLNVPPRLEPVQGFEIRPKQISIIALIAFICSIIGVYFFPIGLVAIGLGAWSIFVINDPTNRRTGIPWGIAGCVLGVVGQFMALFAFLNPPPPQQPKVPQDYVLSQGSTLPSSPHPSNASQTKPIYQPELFNACYEAMLLLQGYLPGGYRKVASDRDHAASLEKMTSYIGDKTYVIESTIPHYDDKGRVVQVYVFFTLKDLGDDNYEVIGNPTVKFDGVQVQRDH